MDGSNLTRRSFLRVSALAAAGAALGLAGCGASRSSASSSSPAASTASPESSSSAVSATRQASEVAGAHGAKPLVVYFSYTGNVDAMAHWIADEAGGDIVRVTARDAYPDDYDATVERAKEELDNGVRPEIDVDLDAGQLTGYDTVFFGFPIWWYDLPMPMCTFLEGHDLSGKEIIPFFSHGGSSSGANSLTTLESLSGGATVRSADAISIFGDSVAESEHEVRDWVKGLGLSAGASS